MREKYSGGKWWTLGKQLSFVCFTILSAIQQFWVLPSFLLVPLKCLPKPSISRSETLNDFTTPTSNLFFPPPKDQSLPRVSSNYRAPRVFCLSSRAVNMTRKHFYSPWLGGDFRFSAIFYCYESWISRRRRRRERKHPSVSTSAAYHKFNDIWGRGRQMIHKSMKRAHKKLPRIFRRENQ
jgi:hypothetical protein